MEEFSHQTFRLHSWRCLSKARSKVNTNSERVQPEDREVGEPNVEGSQNNRVIVTTESEGVPTTTRREEGGKHLFIGAEHQRIPEIGVTVCPPGLVGPNAAQCFDLAEEDHQQRGAQVTVPRVSGCFHELPSEQKKDIYSGAFAHTVLSSYWQGC